MECNIMYIYAIILLVILLIVTAWLGPVPLEHFTLPPGTSRVYNKVSNVDAPFGDIKYYDGAFGDCAKQCDSPSPCSGGPGRSVGSSPSDIVALVLGIQQVKLAIRVFANDAPRDHRLT